jgi:hypothetical protein
MLHKKGAASVLNENVSKIPRIGDQLTPDRNPDGSLNIKAAAQMLIKIGRLYEQPDESSRALSGDMSREEILGAVNDLEWFVEGLSGKNRLKRLWRNIGDTVLGYRTGFKLKPPKHKHYENMDHQLAKGSLVAVMQKRREVGLSPDEAASWLARQIETEPRFSCLVDSSNKSSAKTKTVLRKTIFGWRRKWQTKKSAYRTAYRAWLSWLSRERLSESECKAVVSAIAEQMLPSTETT